MQLATTMSRIRKKLCCLTNVRDHGTTKFSDEIAKSSIHFSAIKKTMPAAGNHYH